MKVFDILPKVVQWESIEYAPDFICPECGKSAIKGNNLYMQPVLEKPDLVGWCETNNGYMAVFECPCCHSKYRFHPHMTLFDADQFDFYLGAYYINHGETEWIANAKELYEKLEKSK